MYTCMNQTKAILLLARQVRDKAGTELLLYIGAATAAAGSEM